VPDADLLNERIWCVCVYLSVCLSPLKGYQQDHDLGTFNLVNLFSFLKKTQLMASFTLLHFAFFLRVHYSILVHKCCGRIVAHHIAVHAMDIIHLASLPFKIF
jgi:hypothetical protein